ncbi:MAG: helix-turn-helix transcriptional regulator [Clostridia bacterium]|nr:helix-turn-helix transcriptional regulator [Clostridia bacterium]
MENITLINQIIARNLASYRKAAGLTQAELAEKINYSDKSVSKWESANGVPDIYILMQLAELYGVTVNDLIGEAKESEIVQRKSGGVRSLIMLLASGIVWLVATCLFVTLQLLGVGTAHWLVFLYAAVVNAILFLVFACIWKYKTLNFISVTVLIWGSLTCLFLTSRLILIRAGNDYGALWTMFLMGIPLQFLEIFWVFFRTLFKKNKQAMREIVEQAEELEEQE